MPPFLFVVTRLHITPKRISFNIVIWQQRGSGWVPVGFTDFKSAGVHPSVCAEGSTPLHSRQRTL